MIGLHFLNQNYVEIYYGDTRIGAASRSDKTWRCALFADGTSSEAVGPELVSVVSRATKKLLDTRAVGRGFKNWAQERGHRDRQYFESESGEFGSSDG